MSQKPCQAVRIDELQNTSCRTAHIPMKKKAGVRTGWVVFLPPDQVGSRSKMEAEETGGGPDTNGTVPLDPHEECMKERKWWCFLLSSVFTFLAGLFIILMWRAFAFLCCRNQDKGAGTKQPGPSKEVAKGAVAGAGGGNEIGFMTEAKDWAGELISGQSTTGRILVSTMFFAYYLSD